MKRQFEFRRQKRGEPIPMRHQKNEYTDEVKSGPAVILLDKAKDLTDKSLPPSRWSKMDVYTFCRAIRNTRRMAPLWR
jgi:hypothetical protein